MNIKTKTYEENGKTYKFSSLQMKAYVNKTKMDRKSQDKRITNNEILSEIAEALVASFETVKNWMYAYNAPGDLEQIKSIGAYFNVDYHVFLEVEEKDMAVVEKDSYQEFKTKECVREIYLLTLNLIREIRGVWGKREVYYKSLDKLSSMSNLIEQKLEDYDLDLPIKFKENVYSYITNVIYDDYILEMMEDGYVVSPDDNQSDIDNSDVENSVIDRSGEGCSEGEVDEYDYWEKEYEKYMEKTTKYLKYGYKKDFNRIFADYKLDQGILKTCIEELWLGGEDND